MDVLLELLASPLPRETFADVGAWIARLKECRHDASIDRALWSGLRADRLGYAFVGGYHAALAWLVGRSGAGCLAATEKGGAHPKAILTTLKDGHLDGEKTFATLANVADELYVVARADRLVIARVRPNAPGIVITPREPTAFAPEVPHAKVTFTNVAVEEVLPGDGYDVYLKPFRTIEDTHVLAATLGYVIGEAQRSGFVRPLIEAAAALVVALRALNDPKAPETHLVLAGIFTAARRLLAEHDGEWAKAPPEVNERWHRDLPLLLIAENVRGARTASAWDKLRPA